MAATGPSNLRRSIESLTVLAVILASFAVIGRADEASDARALLSSVATALSASNAGDAMASFDKSYPKYETLGNYFAGLANAFQIDNEIEVTDEQDTRSEIKLIVHWALTLKEPQTKYTENRAADIDVRLIKLGNKWKIAGFTPIDIFNPRQERFGKP